MHFLSILWNPNETLFNIGEIQIKYYNLLWITSFALGWVIIKKIFTNEKKPIEQLDSLFLYTVIATMLGARLGHVFFYDWAYYQNHLIEILLPIRENPSGRLFGIITGYEFTGFAGLASHGAALGVIIGMYLYSRKYPDYKILWLLDRLVVPVSIGAFFVRLGNFFNSEINGKITEKTFVFATKFIRDSDDMPASRALALTKERTVNAAYNAIENNPKFASILESIPFRHPAQLYEGVCYIFVFIILSYFYWKTDKKDKSGFLFGLFLMLLWTIRFFVEFVKKSQGGFEESLGTLSTGQWLSIPFILIGAYFVFRPKKA
ncbi:MULTISPECIES: prolipoprotein diacylglyceryl transferase [Cellulophaga]|uniref:Phosphatidylglycerol--prolipoprotein diacylglyceryl transferase n=2 Tax=Cellulophaga TaxID=104264 RepID=F0RGC8_CELLC|nr:MULTISPECIES: prolipoprotein diacylglyceryl transferase [Cellulophaga]ADY30119.1 Prolipoprotein diacylglyceryl transferase [Cellulophaga lytica DSM 7489]AIM61113.1 diacylglyceryl transferase [Cellulophaga lytica]EWH13735.1 prolipoprotein diacylglyceryl transferase [Cellulophaga geojensis KL-A]MDO6853602.1 prolipoprotein diacylglyceryl transferase [Cellulophaga lytica]TVZ10551.1 prolipoprotein diacylglyceryl transferase [Cellulophaga sp. RHA_52]